MLVQMAHDHLFQLVAAFLVERSDRQVNLAIWPHSSYQEYVGTRKDNFCERGIVMSQFKNQNDYATFVEEQYEGIKERKEIAAFMFDE